MLTARFIPILLLRDGGLYKGVRFKDYKYVGDPMNAVKIFNNKDVDELLLVDITASREGRTLDPDFIQQVADECYAPFGVGGGIRSVDDMRRLIRAGAEKVSINSAAVETPSLITEGSKVFGRQSIVVSIDVRKSWLGRYEVITHSGTKKTGLDPVAWAQQAETLGAGEILLNSIDRDGTGKGYDLDLVRSVAKAVSIPVVAAGGAGREEDLVTCVTQGHADAAAAGSIFVFHGALRSVLIQYPSPAELNRPPPGGR